MSALRATALFLLAAALLPACSGSDEASVESAHAVFVARTGCAYFIARTTGSGYLVATPTDAYTPRQGDLLVGNAASGTRRLGVVPFGSNDLGDATSFRVVDHDLSLAEAQALYYRFCPLPSGDTAGTP